MDNKYYTPDISDLFVGYECELNRGILPGILEGYHPYVFQDLETLNLVSKFRSSALLRTSYLTNDQIKKEGWQLISQHRPNDFSKGNVIISFENGLLQVEHPSDYNEQGCSPVWMYNGPCPSINEFRKIIKWLEI